VFTVTGRWTVPHVHSFANGDDRHVAVWVGIDGDGSNDVLQAGIRAQISAGDDHPDFVAWFEWFPDDENDIDFPVAAGDLMSCMVTADSDCLPRSAVQHGQWKTIDDGHQLIPMRDGKVLDCKPNDGTWRLWRYDPTHADILIRK
jgi:Peptidase A4 family